MTKPELRRELKARRDSLAKNGYSLEAGTSIANRISALDTFSEADTVLMFYPIGSELNILPLFEISKKLGKKIAFPCSCADGILIFRYVNELFELTARKYNIPEPESFATEVVDLSHSICITPALAFDNDGYRIGYGGGYYDRFLANYNGISVGVVYDDLITNDVPRDKFDLPVDIIITERRQICVKKK